MIGTRTHAERLGNDALGELADAGWPLSSRQATAEWFGLTPLERAEVVTRLNTGSPTVLQRPPYPIDLLYVPSMGGVLPRTGPPSAQAWLASLQPLPGDPLTVFPLSSVRYRRESIDSMRGVGEFEQEPVIGPHQELTRANVVVEPNGLRVITHLRRIKADRRQANGRQPDGRQPNGRQTDFGRSVHVLVPLRTVARIELRASWRTARPGDIRSLAELDIGVSYNDGWRTCSLDLGVVVDKPGITEIDQLPLVGILLDAVAGAQGLPNPDGDLRSSNSVNGGSEVVKAIDFDGAIGFGVATASPRECQTASTYGGSS